MLLEQSIQQKQDERKDFLPKTMEERENIVVGLSRLVRYGKTLHTFY